VIYIAGRGFTNKAVSQVIAALLLIAISVAAAVLVYVFSIGLLGSLQSSGGQQAKQQLIMEAYNWNNASPPTLLVLTVRDVGPAQIQVADVFINGVAVAPSAHGGGFNALLQLNVGTMGTLTLPAAGYNAGVAYTVKIVTIDGAVFSYSALCGQAT
jgi:FlaG/FlaF family flagellin (archaellin)